MCYLCLNACIVGTMTKNTINPARGRDLEGISGTEGIQLSTVFPRVDYLCPFGYTFVVLVQKCPLSL